MGEIPDIDCLKGEEIAIYEPSVGYKTVVRRDETFSKNDGTCVNSSAGQSKRIAGCLKGSRIGKMTNSRGSIFSYLCRVNQSGKFGQVGYIGYSPTTGATCFFEKNQFKTSEDGKLSSPSKDRGLANSPLVQWQTMDTLARNTSSGQCVTCHSVRPFIRNIYALTRETQAFVANPDAKFTGESTVTKLPLKVADGALYHVVHAKELNHMTGTDNWTPKRIVGKSVATCTGCHDLGGQAASRNLTRRIVGLGAIHKTGNLHASVFKFEKGVAASFAMKPDGSELVRQAAIDKAMDAIGSCARKVSDSAECYEELVNPADEETRANLPPPPSNFFKTVAPKLKVATVSAESGSITIKSCRFTSSIGYDYRNSPFLSPSPSFVCDGSYSGKTSNGETTAIVIRGTTLQSTDDINLASGTAEVVKAELGRYVSITLAGLNAATMNLKIDMAALKFSAKLSFCANDSGVTCGKEIEFDDVTFNIGK